MKHLSTEQLTDYLHRELGPTEDAELLAHLESCSDCRSLYEVEAKLSEALRNYGRETERELPQGVVARIWDAVERENSAPSWYESIVAYFRPAVMVPLAAVLVIGLFFGVSSMRTTAPQTIGASFYLENHAAMARTVPFSEGSVVPASLENDQTGEDQHWVAVTGNQVSMVDAGR